MKRFNAGQRVTIKNNTSLHGMGGTVLADMPPRRASNHWEWDGHRKPSVPRMGAVHVLVDGRGPGFVFRISDLVHN